MAARELPPHPAAMVESLRSMGYTPATAIADLVDNSITAGATVIQVTVAPSGTSGTGGYVAVVDNGKGLSQSELREAMRWGGEGPKSRRASTDLGRFGLGMKTASVSMGSILTVASRAKSGDTLRILRWDLRHVIESRKWIPLVGPDPEAEKVINRSPLKDVDQCGTAVVVTHLDRLSVRSALSAHAQRNEAALYTKIADHLGIVFHRYLQSGTTIRLGSTAIVPWDLFAGAVQKDREIFGGNVEVTSYVLPHHSKVTEGELSRMAGPLGWGTHQGFVIYRAKRLIVPGGWLRLFRADESCKLARIRIDLPNDADDAWTLNVMKSSVTPPSWLVADLQRIADATRRQAMEVFNFRGERQAPTAGSNDSPDQSAFWNKLPTSHDVRFKINRAHPVVQTLKQAVRDPNLAESFLTAFERLLPVDAILQDPKRTTNGCGAEPSAAELKDLSKLATEALGTLKAQGVARQTAIEIVLSVEPFLWHAERLRTSL